VLNLFGQSEKGARRGYESFVAKGVKHGRCPNLVGGGLLRSIGGWAELKEFRNLGIRIKGDERLLGSSDFVERVLKQAEEQLEEKYRLRVSAISLRGLMDKTVSKSANLGSKLSGVGKIQKLILDN
jgi:putative transposase